MEKIMLTLWKPSQHSVEQWRRALLDLGDTLLSAGARTLRVMVVDEDVAGASAQRITNSAVPLDGVLSLWLDSASQWPSIKALVTPFTSRLEAYLVLESEPYPEERTSRVAHYRVPVGERTPGMNQVALLHKPDRMSYEHWYDTWRNSHGPKAYPLQSIFGYRQNTVVRALTYGAARDCRGKLSAAGHRQSARVLRRTGRPGHLRAAPAGHVRIDQQVHRL